MSKTLLLTKVLMKSIYDLDATKKKNKRFNLGPLGVAAIVLLLLASISVPIFMVVKDVGATLAPLGAWSLVINILLPIASIVIVVLSVFTIISVFFLSTDNSVLLPLPLQPSQLLLARFFSSLIITYLIELVILLPLLIGLGIGAQLPFDFYLFSVIVLLGLPIIPVAIIGLILTYITRFTNMAKHKDALTYVSFIFILGIALAFNFGFSSMMSSIEMDPNSLLAAIQSLSDQLHVILQTMFPFMLPASYALTASAFLTRILYLLLYLVINAIVLLFFAKVGGIVYFKTIMGSGENPSKKKELTDADFGKNTTSTSILKSYITVEWNLMVRSPIYFLNLIIIIPLLPFIMFASFYFSFNATGANVDMNFLIGLLGGNGTSMADGKLFLIALAILIFFCSISMISSTAISRMGTNAFFTKYIPVTPLTQLRAKMFWGIALSIFLAAMMIVFFVILNLFSWLDGLILLIPTIAVIYLLNYMGLFVDLKRPKLTWTTEASAVKSNLNSLLVMLGSWILGGLLLAAAFLLKLDTLSYGGYVIAGITTILASLLTWIFYSYYRRSCEEVFSAI